MQSPKLQEDEQLHRVLFQSYGHQGLDSNFILKQRVHITANDKVGSALVKITIFDKKVPVDFLASLSHQDVSGRQHLQAPGLANSH